MTVGNIVAIPQTNIKRMLAYSSIAQAGYLILGIATMGFSPQWVIWDRAACCSSWLDIPLLIWAHLLP